MNKKIMTWILTFIFLVSTVSAAYVSDHATCPDNYQSQNCIGSDRACGYASSTLYCALPAVVNAAVPGTTDTVSSTQYNSGIGGGYVYDCTQASSACTNWECQRDNVCYSTRNKDTTCLANQRAGSGEGVSFNCGSCRSGYNDCDSDGVTCEIQNGASCGTNGVYSGCDAPNGNCVCAAGYNDCDGTGAASGNGCEIQDGAACTLNGAAGTYQGCQGAVGLCSPTKSYFETGTLSTYLTNQSLLWGKNLGSGFLMNLSNGTGLEFKIDNDACIVFRDGSTQCSSSGSGSGSGEAAGWSSNGVTTNTSLNVRMGVGNDFYYNAGTGNIGIGSATPGEKLYVSGNINASGDICLDGGNCLSTVGADAAGTQGAIQFYKDGNLGGNASQFFLNESTGNVGIGTSAPTSNLHIVDVGYTLLKVKDATNNVTNIMASGAAGGSIGTFSENKFFLLSNNSVGLTLDTSGNIGLNTTSPEEQLHVEGNTLMNGNLLAGAGTQATTSAAAVQVWNTASTDAYYNDGDVGIGTSTPLNTLHLHASTDVIRMTNPGTGTTSADGMFIGHSGASATSFDIWNYENNYTRFATNNAERMRINENGKVGIGTTSPQHNLHVYSSDSQASMMLQGSDSLLYLAGLTTDDRGRIQLDDYGSEDWFIAAGDAANGAFSIDRDSGDGASDFVISMVGNVGIGISDPISAKLQISNPDTTSNYNALYIDNDEPSTWTLYLTGDSGNGIYLGTTTDNNCYSAGSAAACSLNDYAEMMEFSELPQDGELIIIDTATPGLLKTSTEPYSKLVAGIASEEPAMVIGSYGINIKGWNKNETNQGDHYIYPLAIAGRKIIQVTNENGKVMPGDLLVTSSQKGKAMRCDRSQYLDCIGGIVGKAMTEEENGKVLALIMLQ